MKKILKEEEIFFDIDWQGAQKLVDYSKNDVVNFVLPPSNKILLERLKKRNEDSDKIVKKNE